MTSIEFEQGIENKTVFWLGKSTDGNGNQVCLRCYVRYTKAQSCERPGFAWQIPSVPRDAVGDDRFSYSIWQAGIVYYYTIYRGVIWITHFGQTLGRFDLNTLATHRTLSDRFLSHRLCDCGNSALLGGWLSYYCYLFPFVVYCTILAPLFRYFLLEQRDVS